MSSVSGTIGYPLVGAYAASKHGLEGFSESLRRELMLFGIDVIIIGPGSVATPIWDKAEQADISLYENTEYVEPARRIREYMLRHGRSGFPAKKIGEVVLHALTTPKPRVRYAVVPGSLIRQWLLMFAPKRVIDSFIARNFGFK
jgi:short-subunit dehydrogenase